MKAVGTTHIINSSTRQKTKNHPPKLIFVQRERIFSLATLVLCRLEKTLFVIQHKVSHKALQHSYIPNQLQPYESLRGCTSCCLFHSIISLTVYCTTNPKISPTDRMENKPCHRTLKYFYSHSAHHEQDRKPWLGHSYKPAHSRAPYAAHQNKQENTLYASLQANE